MSHDELLERSVRANVARSVDELADDRLLARLVEEDKLKIVGAEYHLHSGEVRLI